ncbi:MAG: PTS sugar transporter subunit IIC [Fusobacterium sp.]|nr:PTS sugar transporter subunit IIC [Fusobacterium sp.]
MKNFFIKSLNGMALGLFSSLITGLILKQLGLLFSSDFLIQIGSLAQFLMGPAIGAGIAFALNSHPLIIIAALITGAFGAGTIKIVENISVINIGEPIGAYFSTVFVVFFINKLAGKTKFDIILLPCLTIILGCLIGKFCSPFISELIKNLGFIINKSTELNPILMGLTISVIMGMLLTLPTSSAAIGISLGLNGLAAGSALTGCCCQMIGFAIMSYEDNDIGSVLSIGFGTSMIQIPNIIKNPLIWIPPIISSALLGILSTTVFNIQTNSVASGMGTSGLVGQLSTFTIMGRAYIFPMLILHFILPAFFNYFLYKFMKKKNYIKNGDLKIS